jgi:hypothetical protein
MWLLAGTVALLPLLMGSGLWAGLVWPNARTNAQAANCCDDPTCPPGCSEVCPPACTGSTTAKAQPAAKTSDCCSDPTCFPGCCPECPPDCLDLTAKSKNVVAARQTTNGTTFCPPCPSCP